MAIAILGIAVGCTKTEIGIPVSNSVSHKSDLKQVMTVPFIIAQNIDGGEVDISDDANGITINADISGSGWEFRDNHIYVGSIVPPSNAPGQLRRHYHVTRYSGVLYLIQ